MLKRIPNRFGKRSNDGAGGLFILLLVFGSGLLVYGMQQNRINMTKLQQMMPTFIKDLDKRTTETNSTAFKTE